MVLPESGLLAIIPARGGSKGLPGKNIRLLAGVPLIAHSILMARSCSIIDRCVISTDSFEIANMARQFGADVPFMRPTELAQDDTPMWPVLRHALDFVETLESRHYEYLLLLDPTSPGRLPQDVDHALTRLKGSPDADGIIGVSQPEFNPIWHCVVEREGWMADMFSDATNYTRRQDVPTIYRINATLYIWRAAFVRRETTGVWRAAGKHLIYEVPEVRAIHIDNADEFARADLLIRNGLIRLPWLSES